MTSAKHTIMIVDDHPIIHDGLRILVEDEPDLEIISGAFSSNEAMDMLKERLPDLVIVDLSMGDADGVYFIQRVHSAYPKLKIMVYTMSEERLYADRTAMAGARGYVMKTVFPTKLKEAIRTVIAGNLCFTADIQERIELKLNGHSDRHHTVLDVLSNREMDIFRLLGDGLNSAAIGRKLAISRNTVDTHRINIKNKLDQPNGKALERLAYEVFKQNRFSHS